MTPTKRVFDIVLALFCAGLLILPCFLIATFLLFVQGRPVFYFSERMKTHDQSFCLWKFRSMQCTSVNIGVSGGDKAVRITPTGHFLRRTRLDEVPQLWNILRGEMSFVGPRPPLRAYVERFPNLYADVLQSRPGITGLATIIFHKREEQLLADCTTPAQTDAVYVVRCLPRKARLDLIYQKNQTLVFDIALLMATVLALGKNSRSA